LQGVPGVAGGLRCEAERAAGDVARGGERQQHHLAERERHQREIVADDAQAETRIADDDGE